MVIPGTSHDLGLESSGSDAERNIFPFLPGSQDSIIFPSSMIMLLSTLWNVLRLGEVFTAKLSKCWFDIMELWWRAESEFVLLQFVSGGGLKYVVEYGEQLILRWSN